LIELVESPSTSKNGNLLLSERKIRISIIKKQKFE
jgi:hypothetical protein